MGASVRMEGGGGSGGMTFTSEPIASVTIPTTNYASSDVKTFSLTGDISGYSQFVVNNADTFSVNKLFYVRWDQDNGYGLYIYAYTPNLTDGTIIRFQGARHDSWDTFCANYTATLLPDSNSIRLNVSWDSYTGSTWYRGSSSFPMKYMYGYTLYFWGVEMS